MIQPQMIQRQRFSLSWFSAGSNGDGGGDGNGGGDGDGDGVAYGVFICSFSL